MTKNEIISGRILNLIANGLSPVDAAREVLGADAVNEMIENLYTELRKKAGL